MTEQATKPPTNARSDDWRILAILGPYRLLLVAALLFLFRFNLAPDYFREVSAHLLMFSCFAYAGLALTLQFLALNQRFSLTAQALLHFAVDLTALGLLVYTTGGVGGGLGILLVPPLVGCSLVLTPRLGLVFAAAATLTVFGEEAARQLHAPQLDSGDFSQAGLLGLMFFATSLTAAMVGLRARRSEAVAARVGSEFINLTRLNDNIIAAMQAGVLVVDVDGRVRTANAAALRLTGDQASVDSRLDTALPSLHAALLDWRNGVSPASNAAIAGPSGRELLPRFTRLGWGDQAPTLIMLEDAGTLRMQAQQMKLAALGRLSANIAHEIRNPLSAITQAGQLLAEQSDFEPGNRRLLDMIQRHAVRIEHIVRSVLDISRREPAAREPLNLRDHLRRSAALYHESYAQQIRPIELADVPSDLDVLFAPDQLQQVLFNLWDNSFEHGGADGRTITVLLQSGIEADSGLPWLELGDNGVGLPAELLDRVFEPFFTTHAAGTGLGLYLSRELCEYNQARLSCVPSQHGACFRIVFSTPVPP
ncbi:two-component system sensor histidine kinase NtrB [Solimonas terrae]|uniref:histidine kinase n=1 Tax=Solimonas terrae TaxID=1396819 RepID=A0A6M2BRM2_9GAMM|nr:ATP-binding protein [Solimonas terrae]NGY05256.1 PAS domain-containing protein [Solimonas terrae]